MTVTPTEAKIQKIKSICFYYELEWLQILRISTFQPPSQMFTENQTGQSARNTHCSSLANTKVVPSPATIPLRPTLDSAPTPGSSETPFTQSTPPAAQETPPNGMSCVRGALSHHKFSEEVTDVLILLHMALGYLYLSLGPSHGGINPLKSHGISAFWSCDRIGKLNETCQ